MGLYGGTLQRVRNDTIMAIQIFKIYHNYSSSMDADTRKLKASLQQAPRKEDANHTGK